MIGASHVKVHPDAAGARGGNQAMNQTKESSIPRYIWPWGNPLRVLITEGSTADCTQAHALTDGVNAQYLLADRGYDSDAIIEEARQANMDTVIPSRKNRTVQREYGKYIYRQRHLAENAFLKLNRWRGIATQHAKNAASFLASVHIQCLVLWLDIS